MKAAFLIMLEAIDYAFSIMGNLTSGFLTASFSRFGAVNAAMRAVSEDVAKPVAYTLLAILLLVDLYQVSMQISQQGGNSMAPATSVLRSVLKYGVVKWAIDNASVLLTAIFSTCISITSGIESHLPASSIASFFSTEELKNMVNDLTGGVLAQIGSLIVLLLALIGAYAAVISVAIIVMSRFVQLYIYLAFAPVPISMLPDSHTCQIGIGFLKGFTGVCLQSAVIALTLRMFPYFMAAFVTSADSLVGLAFNTLLMSFALAASLTTSGAMAKALVGGG